MATTNPRARPTRGASPNSPAARAPTPCASCGEFVRSVMGSLRLARAENATILFGIVKTRDFCFGEASAKARFDIERSAQRSAQVRLNQLLECRARIDAFAFAAPREPARSGRDVRD